MSELGQCGCGLYAEYCEECATREFSKNEKHANLNQSGLVTVYVQRFRAALPSGYRPDNPEDLIRDENGEFVKYSDLQKIVAECLEWNWLESEYENIPEAVRKKMESIAYGT